MTAYPILFNHRVVFQVGDDYAVTVDLHGGAVVTVEDDGSYLAHGLHPGGVSGEGGDLTEACNDLRDAITIVVFELALEAADPEAFGDYVDEFFKDSDEWGQDTFEAARASVRDGAVDTDLPRNPDPSFHYSISVDLLHKPEMAQEMKHFSVPENMTLPERERIAV